MARSAVIIPARYGSTRFPGKPLARLAGKSMIHHVYDRASASKADVVIVATDDERIVSEVESFGGKAMMTSPDCQSGTDRIAEVAAGMPEPPEIVINVQGDEPLMPSSVIDRLIDLMASDPSIGMATVAVPADRSKMTSDNVKVVFGTNGDALYFSRCDIPFVRSGGVAAPMYLHWGIYAYRADVLRRFVSLPPSALENSEKLEQLRALENGIGIKVICSELETIGVDTPADIERAERKLMEFASK
ncbi:MAG: 3-deoxy-manno-octulosonate cytidylyltransferase [Victivallaceae bacterium]|nr:3-deoxy-manno-octulosonate cytidylyltransferase [Victivallaceae bacterium]